MIDLRDIFLKKIANILERVLEKIFYILIKSPFAPMECTGRKGILVVVGWREKCVVDCRLGSTGEREVCARWAKSALAAGARPAQAARRTRLACAAPGPTGAVLFLFFLKNDENSYASTTGEQAFYPGYQLPLVPVFQPGSGAQEKRVHPFSPGSNNRD